MKRTTILRIFRIASTQFSNLATGYFGVSIFAPILVPDVSYLFVKNLALGISCLFCVYMCEKVLDER
jgi:hypothetical protein